MKLLEIISFFQFLTQIGQKFGPKHPTDLAYLPIFALTFHSGICTTTTFCFKRYSPCKIWKKTLLIIPISLLFFTTLGQIWPQDPTHFDFFAGFQWNMLRDSININNFNWNLVVLKKKLLKPLKITIFWPKLRKNGAPWAMPKRKKQLFLKN